MRRVKLRKLRCQIWCRLFIYSCSDVVVDSYYLISVGSTWHICASWHCKPVTVYRPVKQCSVSESRWFNIEQNHSWPRLATGWTGSHPGGGEIFRTRPDRPWGPLNVLYNGYRVFPGRKVAGAWRWAPTPSGAEVKERVDLYLYSPSGPSWLALGWTYIYSSIFPFLIEHAVKNSSKTFWKNWNESFLKS
jgi:hypothetical protein